MLTRETLDEVIKIKTRERHTAALKQIEDRIAENRDDPEDPDGPFGLEFLLFSLWLMLTRHLLKNRWSMTKLVRMAREDAADRAADGE